MEEIDLYAALAEMRRLTALGKSFSFKHACYNREKRHSDGIRFVRDAKLRPAAKGDDIVFAGFKLFYEDLNNMTEDKNRNCWQVLIMEFNGKRIRLN